jgi:hypothetical protein
MLARSCRSRGTPHRDPGDRFVVATAKVYDLTLVTTDERLASLNDVKILAKRWPALTVRTCSFSGRHVSSRVRRAALR